MKISMKLVCQYMIIFFNFSPPSNHLHPLQVENCDSNSWLVVDEDDNGKFRPERVNVGPPFTTLAQHTIDHNNGANWCKMFRMQPEYSYESFRVHLYSVHICCTNLMVDFSLFRTRSILFSHPSFHLRN